MAKKIVVINGHPNPSALNAGLAQAYVEGARNTGAEVREIVISSLSFDPNLRYGYQKRMELEPDLQQAWEDMLWAEHLVWVHPVWWGGLPALMKGFIDRLFLPGRAFSYRENSIFWDKLLKGRTARIITTLDQPGWIYRLLFGRPSVNQLRKSTLEFCGIKPVGVTYVGVVKNATVEQRSKWVKQARRLGEKWK